MDFPTNSVRLLIDALRGRSGAGFRELGLACTDLLKWAFTTLGDSEEMKAGRERAIKDGLNPEQLANQLEQACDHHSQRGSQPDFAAGLGIDWASVALAIVQLLQKILQGQELTEGKAPKGEEGKGKPATDQAAKAQEPKKAP